MVGWILRNQDLAEFPLRDDCTSEIKRVLIHPNKVYLELQMDEAEKEQEEEDPARARLEDVPGKAFWAGPVEDENLILLAKVRSKKETYWSCYLPSQICMPLAPPGCISGSNQKKPLVVPQTRRGHASSLHDLRDTILVILGKCRKNRSNTKPAHNGS